MPPGPASKESLWQDQMEDGGDRKHIIALIDSKLLFNTNSHYLQLRLSLGLLEDRFHLRSLHNIAFNFQLPRHEQPLCVRFAADKLSKVLVG